MSNFANKTYLAVVSITDIIFACSAYNKSNSKFQNLEEYFTFKAFQATVADSITLSIFFC